MDRFPVLLEGKTAGELTTEREALYTWFTARCRLPRKGLWCAWAVGERGELRLGVLEPAGEQSVIRRRFSDRMTAPLGRLLRGEIRPAGEREETWVPAPAPDRLFRTPWLRRQLQNTQGVLTRTERECRFLAIPYDAKQPFRLTALFCFARLRPVGGKPYVVYGFDKEEWPVFQ